MYLQLSQCSSTYFADIVKSVAFEGLCDCEFETLLGHTRYNQRLDGVLCLVRMNLEDRLDMYNLTTNDQKPCRRPRLTALLAFALRALLMMIDRRGNSGKLVLFVKDNIVCFDYEVNDIQ